MIQLQGDAVKIVEEAKASMDHILGLLGDLRVLIPPDRLGEFIRMTEKIENMDRAELMKKMTIERLGILLSVKTVFISLVLLMESVAVYADAVKKNKESKPKVLLTN